MGTSEFHHGRMHSKEEEIVEGLRGALHGEYWKAGTEGGTGIWHGARKKASQASRVQGRRREGGGGGRVTR